MASNGTDSSTGQASPAPLAAPTGASAEEQARFTDTQLCLNAVDKALRMHALYEGNGENYLKARSEAFRLMQNLLERHGEIKLYIEPHQFILDGSSVWINESDKQGPSYRLFKDGLRIIGFEPGLDLEEFMLLIEAMQGAQPGQEVHSAVTMLWENDPPHIKHRAISIFHEGTQDSDLGGESEDISDIVGVLRQPLHRQGKTYPAPKVPADARKKAASVRGALLARLQDQGNHKKFLAGLRREVIGAREDIWPRAIHIAARMVQVGLDSEQVSAILSQVLEEMLAGGQWSDLGKTCKVMGATIAGGGSDEESNAHLKEILAALTEEGRLQVIAPRLLQATPEELEELAGFLLVLPEEANDDLRELLLKMPVGPTQSRFRKLLEERGVDMTEIFAENLQSNNQEQVLSAIQVLSDMDDTKAIRKLPAVLNHPSARVRLEALKALSGRMKPEHLSEETVAELIPSLAAGYPQLHEAVYAVLAKLPRCSQSDLLVELLERPDPDNKLDQARRLNIYMLMVRWGGTQVDDFIINNICAGGLFIGRKKQQLKEDLFTALEAVGGQRAQNLIAACRSRQPGKAVRNQLDEVAQKVR